MKAKALLVVVLCVMGLAALSIGKAEAAFTYFTVTISETGANTNGATYITVTDTNIALPAFPANTTFILDNSTLHANAMLAAALTGFANSSNLKILLNTPINPFDLCFGVAVQR